MARKPICVIEYSRGFEVNFMSVFTEKQKEAAKKRLEKDNWIVRILDK